MNTVDAKRVLETALICAPQPVPLRELRVLFNDALGSDTLEDVAAGPAARLVAAGRGIGAGGYRLALSEPSRNA